MKLPVKTIVHSRIPAIVGASESRVESAVNITANNIVLLAMRASRYRTGNMRAGWDKEKLGPATVKVFNNVHYTIYHEYGTMYMPAQPMLGPAVQQELPEFQRRMAEAYK